MSRSADDKITTAATSHQSLPEIALDSTSEGIVVADENGKFVVWNRAATQMLGIGAADVDPQHWSEYYRLYLPDSNEIVPSEQLPLRRAMKGEIVDDQDIVVRDERSGRRTWLSCNARPLRDEAGEVKGGVVVFRDVTERRRVERELASYAQTVSHDLKAPLTGVVGFAQMLEQDCAKQLGPEGLEYLGHIMASAERMRSLIDDLLRHTRIDHDWLSAEPVDLNDVVQRALQNLEGAIQSSGAEIEVQEGLPVISGYAAGLEQLFQNLVGNAIKFVAPGKRPRIQVGCVDGERSCKLHVRDNGVGIEAKYRQDVFEVFRRLHGREEYGGTGIGLAIVKKIADLHHGDVWVESDPGLGSTFWVRLPKPRGE